MTSNINATVDKIVNLLEGQKELLAPSQREVIMAATHYTFESDGSVALSGPLGSMWVFKDGTVTEASQTQGAPGYPAYVHPDHLRVAKNDALGLLGLTTIVEKFGRKAVPLAEEVENGTDVPDIRNVYYFPDTNEYYNEGYRSGGTWVDGWWA